VIILSGHCSAARHQISRSACSKAAAPEVIAGVNLPMLIRLESARKTLKTCGPR
jgi:mannose/fructose-specific phosphotransferase system component IIA